MMTRGILSAIFVLVLSGLSAGQAENAFAAGQVIITQAAGEALMGAEDMHQAEKGMACSVNDRLKTGAGGQMDVALNGIAGCRLLASSSARLASTDQDKMKIVVEEGNVILNLQKLPAGSSFDLETPTAVASVRGTQFWGRVLPGTDAGTTTFAVREGSIDVTDKASGKSFQLQQGQALDIVKDALPEVRPALEAELQAMKQASDIATSI